MRIAAVICGLFLISSCATYTSDFTPPTCETDVDCNPVMTCGELIPCIDGQCDPSRKYEKPCQMSCTSNAECLLADRDCCCGSQPSDYIAIPQADLAAWLSRPECQAVDCPAIECLTPDGIQAVCRDGECLLEADRYVWSECGEDSDCLKVPVDCPSCDCHNGYPEDALNRLFEQAYLESLEIQCALTGACPPGPYRVDACTNRPAICWEGICRVLGEVCDCPRAWDPVCTRLEGERVSFPNQCQTGCLGLEWTYRGRCECEMACLNPRPVCADNNVTYWCNSEEALCSGHQVSYQGDCRVDCNYCFDLDREPIPVCGSDFVSYSDMCFAECHDRAWWHQARCLSGEGSRCDAGTSPVPCPDPGLVCRIDEYCQDCPGCPCPGTCIVPGACLIVEDCQDQVLDHPDCPGHWTCQSHICTWECY